MDEEIFLSTPRIAMRRRERNLSQGASRPLPRRGKRVIQVADIEYEPTFGGRISSEVKQMAVAACLHAQASYRCDGEVSGHVKRRSTVEGELRGHFLRSLFPMERSSARDDRDLTAAD